MPRALCLMLVLTACADTQVKGTLDLGGMKVEIYPELSIHLDDR